MPRIKPLAKRLSLWLSILLHLLLFICFLTFNFLPKTELTKNPHQFIPATLYTGAITPMHQPSLKARPQKHFIQAKSPQTKSDTHGLKPQKLMPTGKSLLAASFATLQKEQLHALTQKHEEEPIYLVGEENQAPNPLIQLLGRALSAHFQYPETAGKFGITGRVLIRLTLHPGGYFTNVQMVQSSHNQDLDAAALYAVNTAPVMKGVKHFLKKPKQFLVGFIFKTY